jgi:predicted nucleic acid-binding Zn ribbon protein
MVRDRCPCCRAILPLPKTCPVCGKTFYRSEGGRTDATYCSERCAGTARMRRYRKRNPGK